MQAAHVHIGLANVVMGRHDQMRQHGLDVVNSGFGWLHLRFERAELADDLVRPPRCEEIELALARSVGAMVGEIDDLALTFSLDRGMG